jgi:3-hydroxyacyl-[acyl-carrier-protein] dehydratase
MTETGKNSIIIGREQVEAFLPHRKPFLFVDRVSEFVVEKQILAECDLRGDEPHFQGHFPGKPIMPGVLITEALAQTSGLLLALTAQEKGLEAKGKMFYLARADMKWLSPVHPGVTLKLEAKLLKILKSLTAFRVRAFTDQGKVAAGSLTLAQVV